MPWPVHPTGFFGARGDSDTYRIERSLRFNSADSTYLNRTPAGAGNRKTWTWSGWVKRGILGTAQTLFSCGTAANDTGNMGIGFLQSTNLDSLRIHGFATNFRVTTMQFRDPSAWYHIIVAIDSTNATASNRIKMYVNGVEITSFLTSNDLTLNTDYGINQALQHGIGRYEDTASSYFNGYLTEINFIDGQALTPSSFGETDAITGRWKAKAYSGTYGTNGFYLSFKDNTSTTTLGYDDAGSNDWTLNNFSVTAGAGNDSLVDSPTNYGSDSGVGGQVRGNYSTLNVTDINSSIALVSNGNLEFTQNSNGTIGIRRSTIAITSGKWYFEAVPANVTAFSTQHTIGIVGTDHSLSNYVGSGANGYAYRPDGNKLNNGTATAYGTTTTANTDVVMVAFDADNWKIWFGKNGTWFASGDPVAGTNAAFSSIVGGTYLFAVGSQHTGFGAATWITNFGQRPFAYTAPSGFKALCTTNLTTPTIKKPSSYMDVVTYTGNGGTQTISGLGFSPDLLWTKGRSQTSGNHLLTDSVRGNGKSLMSNTTGSEDTRGATLTSDGFTYVYPNEGGDGNFSAATYVAWSWDAGSTNSTNTSGSITSTVRANPQSGFSIVSYTGTGANATVGHGLGVAPKMVIVKARNQSGLSYSWVVWHSALSGSEYLILNLTQAKASASTVWNSAIPTASAVNLGTDAGTNGSAVNYISYCFSEIEGYSKFGSYTGNGSADGPFVWCGFRPRWVMIKRADSSVSGFWTIFDSARETSNVMGSRLWANVSDQESSDPPRIDFVSNGYKIRTVGDPNTSSGTFIFAAFAESPFKYARAR